MGMSCRSWHRRALATIVTLLVGATMVEAGVVTEAKPPVKKSRIALADFTFRNAATFRGQETFSTRILTEKLTTALVATRKFDVLERDALEEVMTELDLATSQVADKRNAPRRGRIAAADYLIKGEISVYDVKSALAPIPTTSYFNSVVTGDIICNLRVIDVETGKIASAAKVEAINKVSWRTSSTAAPQIEAAFYDDLQSQLVTKIANKVIEVAFPMKVIGVQGDTVYLNRGEGSGLREGDVIAVFRRGDALIDPDTNEELGFEESLVGEAVVQEVLPTNTRARWQSGAALPERGMIARIKR